MMRFLAILLVMALFVLMGCGEKPQVSADNETEPASTEDQGEDIQEVVSITADLDPGNLVSYRGENGQVFYFQVTGSADGSVWGDGIYTDDSYLATAAVHAGVLSPGEFGVVKVTILPGEDSYTGGSRNGVTSMDYGDWSGSYQVEAASEDVELAPIADPGSLVSYRGQTGNSFLFQVTGSSNGSIWGTDIYTDDSSLATAAVHSGVLSPGESGVVLVTILPGEASYTGSTQNSVTSSNYGAWSGSFCVEAP